MADDYVDQVAGAIIRQLKEGTAPWQKPWQAGERFMPYNPTTGNAYHGMNALWLMSEAERRGLGDARWLTFKQAEGQGAYVRKGEKGYGTNQAMEGRAEAGQRVVMIEDIVTSGGAALMAVDKLREAGLEVPALLCVVDREEGGRAAIEAKGLTLDPLFTATSLGIKKA